MAISHGNKVLGELSRVALNCPSCDSRLAVGRPLERADGARLSHYQCSTCLHYCLALIMRTQVGLSSIVMVTDLAYEDVMRLHNAQPITSDEVIALHQLMNRKDAKLFLAARVKKRID